MQKNLSIKGCRVHNLKNLNLDLPRNKFIVITGISGSGKSSLAFDTIYAEGQRRYVESFSNYSRQFIATLDKPDLDQITGLAPAVAIDQKTGNHNPRSTVGTLTEIYDYLRLLFSRLGIPHCPRCETEITRQSPEQILAQIQKLPQQAELLILAPIIQGQKGEHRTQISEARRSGYTKLRIDGRIYTVTEATNLKLDLHKKHSLELVISKIILAHKPEAKTILQDLRLALELGNGNAKVYDQTHEQEWFYSERLTCPKCQLNFAEIEPRHFSFNSPEGACPDCTGLGVKLKLDPDLIIPNKRLSLAEGALRPWARTYSQQSGLMRGLEQMAARENISLTVPVQDLSAEDLEKVLMGAKDYEGVIPQLQKRYQETDSEYLHSEIERYMRVYTCPSCLGKRLKPEALSITLNDKNIAEVSSLALEKLNVCLQKIHWENRAEKIAIPIVKEMLKRLQRLIEVGLGYLTLDRAANTLAGGEAQRIRLANQLGSGLTGVIYVLDEPSIGLHQCDNKKLIQTLKNLRDLENTVIVVEHDAETMRAADYLVDIGPGAGKYGGEIIAAGTLPQVLKNKKSLTAAYLNGQREVKLPKKRHPGNGQAITILGASQFNLKNIDAIFPLGQLVCVTGVSGSGKSTLVTDILAKALAKHFYQAKENPGAHKAIKGLEYLDKVIHIDQSPIGRTPRSNPATYTGIFTYIRDLFTQLPEACIKNYKAGHFSFNVKGGRCEACQGDGVQKIAMHFLPDVYVKCEHCQGHRFNSGVLEVHYRGKNISEILELTVEEAYYFFADKPILKEKLKILREVGLDYLCLGQSATTLSGGEAQRIKLATELSRRPTGKTLYILDEPTTGLHFADVEKLLLVLDKLVEKGNSVFIVEHNLEVIKCADYILDLGPEGGEKGGAIVAAGTPEEIAKNPASKTGQYLKKIL